MNKVAADNRSSCFIFAGGGTAGHVNPALSVAKELKRLAPEVEILFLVSPQGLEKELVEEAGYPYEIIKAEPLPLKKVGYPLFALRNFLGCLKSYNIIKKHNCKAVLGTGGFVSGPVLLAAHWAHIPSYLHEQNAYPGRTNRYLARWAKAVCLSFKASKDFFDQAQGNQFYHSGNPIKDGFFSQDKEIARAKLGFTPEDTVVVAVGGSLGAKSLNQAVEALPTCQGWQAFLQQHPHFKLVLSTGKVNKRFLHNELPTDEHLIFAEYLNTEDYLPAADLLIGRASGGFLAEAAATGQASILIPFPQAAEDHQSKNAEVFVQAAASVLLKDEDLSAQSLLDTMQALLADKQRLAYMRESAQNLARPDAAEIIAKLMLDEAR